jgi:hypothetical protein
VAAVAELGALGRFTRLKLITTILICQFVLGLVVALFAYGDIHSSAMGMEYNRGMQREFEQFRRLPEYREPPAVRGHSFERLLEDRYTDASQRGHAALLAFGTGLGASLLAGVLLWLLGRVQRRSHEHTTP